MNKYSCKTAGEEWNRMWASASFVALLIIIGVPLWWKTTEVYRVDLPYGKLSTLGSQPHEIAAALEVFAEDDAVAKEVAGLIEKTFQDVEILKLHVKPSVLPESVRSELSSAAGEASVIGAVYKMSPDDEEGPLRVIQWRGLRHDVWVGEDNVVLFKDAAAAPTLVKVLKQWIYQTHILSGVGSAKPDVNRRVRIAAGTDVHIALSVVEFKGSTLDFDAGEAMEDYIGSFADELTSLYNFTLSSQWLHFLDFDFKAVEVKDDSEWGRHFEVPISRLPALLTRLEERAATHVAARPTVNLQLLVAPCSMAPLRLRTDDDDAQDNPSAVQAFLSPAWGGVALVSPGAEACARGGRWHPDVRQVMGTFVSQLRKLLGIPDSAPISGAVLAPLRSVRPRRWERTALRRARTLEQLASAQATLRSLAQLLGEISNIVINDEVGASILSAVDHISQAGSLLASPVGSGPAHAAARAAFTAADSAFYHHTLLALLYFPDDQKYAIYIPLFLPIMFPVVLSLKNLVLWLRGKHAKSKTD